MTQDKLPTSKVERASRFLKTGLKVGGNYVAHYTKSAFTEVDRNDLDRKNAIEILNVLRQLKGSGLKIAQMLSMDNGGLLPKTYAEVFAGAQNNAMALSGPMVLNTFKKYWGKTPYELYDSFNPISILAASIGQVHEAKLSDKKLAVKIQYPGVADSIKSDLNMVKPVVLKVMGLPSAVMNQYMDEIEERLIEETDYELELKQALFVKKELAGFENIIIPNYYPELSNKRILTMDWLEGTMLSDFIKTETDPVKRQIIGQSLLDFLHFQTHTLKKFHADLHPGNFIVTNDLKLGILDFGCMKSLPPAFYNAYFSLGLDAVINDPLKFREMLMEIDLIREGDSVEEEKLFLETALNAIKIIARPLMQGEFDFSNEAFYQEMLQFGEEIYANKDFRKPNAIRGSKHAIYLHRAFYGLYGLLHQLGVNVKIDRTFFDKLNI